MRLSYATLVTVDPSGAIQTWFNVPSWPASVSTTRFVATSQTTTGE